MSDVDTTEETESTEEVETETTDTEQESETTEVAPDLGDAGKKAIDAMKAKWKTAESKARDLSAELAKRDAAIANQDKPAEERALDEARAEARAEEREASNLRTKKIELKAAAKGRLADPTDAHLYIELADITVDENGDVDSDALDEAIAELLVRKPHLGVPSARRFEGAADQGSKGRAVKPSQLTREQFAALSNPERLKAHAEGRTSGLLNN
jgi:hypothetical protein